MRLITEQFITEARKDDKHWFIEGVFMQSNVKNRNNRIYPKQTLDEEVDRYIQNYVKQDRAIGELNHPNSPTINLDRVCHKITELSCDGDNWVGKSQILNTPMGKVVEGLLEAGVKPGVSSPGLGTVKEKDGVNEVQSDFKLATIDVVSDPSAPDAYVKGLNEDVEWVFCEDSKCYVKSSIVEQHKEIAIEQYSTLTEGQKLQMFTDFINNLRK